MPHDVTLEAITGFRLVTANAGRMTAFYRAIGFDIGTQKPISAEEMGLLGLRGDGHRIAMALGQSRVDLDVFEHSGRAYPADAAACDLVFQHFALVTDDAGAAWDRARKAGAAPISTDGPVQLPQSAGGVVAVKFRDPDGHPLEFLEFPPGASSNWTGTGIMGIDHSAISVSDVAVSQRFYARHGLNAGTATLNRGATQVSLDGLDGVVVDVVPMLPSQKPPHVELLGYRTPVGRACSQLAANDIAATRIVWRSDDTALLRDPDGHLHHLSR